MSMDKNLFERKLIFSVLDYLQSIRDSPVPGVEIQDKESIDVCFNLCVFFSLMSFPIVDGVSVAVMSLDLLSTSSS